MKVLGVVVGLVLLVAGLMVLSPAAVAVVSSATFSALWHWSVLGGLVSACLGVAVLRRHNVLV